MEEDSRTSTLREYLDVLSRRKWIALQAVVLVPAAAMLSTLREPALYQISATVGPMLDDLGRVLRSSPAAKLGVIVAGANLERRYGYLTSPYQASASRQAPETTTSPPA